MVRLFLAFLILETSLIAACDRGARLISEAGGAQGIAGTAAPQDAQSLAGVVGISDPNQVPPFDIIPTIPNAPGILDFADFYALMPSDNPNPILANAPVLFPRLGSSNGGIRPVEGTSAAFDLAVPGTYLVLFNASITGPGQLMLRITRREVLPETVVGRNTGNTQIVGFGLITTLFPHAALEVINPPGNAPITLTPFAGDVGGDTPVSAHLVIIRIQ